MGLSSDQERGRLRLWESVDAGAAASVLTGPAGSGKTTLLRTIAEDAETRRRRVVLLAPTGKAASVLRAKSGRLASTIHKALFRHVEEDGSGNPVFGAPGWPCAPGDLIFVDEASMVGKELYGTLMANLPPGAQVIFVGDREQLPPVGDGWGPDFSRPTAVLEEVHRQALESPIIRIATYIRQSSPGWTWRSAWREVSDTERRTTAILRKAYPREAAGWLADLRARGQDATIISWRNKTRMELNERVREKRGLTAEFPQPGDFLVCLKNNHGADIMNGEVLQVRGTMRPPGGGPFPAVEVDLWGDQRRLWVRPDFVSLEPKEGMARWLAFEKLLRDRYRDGDGDPAGRWCHADIGEALTCHKAQGSEFMNVGIVAERGLKWMAKENPEDFRRWAYTAVTRARENLVVFEQ